MFFVPVGGIEKVSEVKAKSSRSSGVCECFIMFVRRRSSMKDSTDIHYANAKELKLLSGPEVKGQGHQHSVFQDTVTRNLLS